MRRKASRAFALTILASFAILGFGQAATKSEGAPGFRPFTAKTKTTTVQTLANGVTITRVSKWVEAVDSHGHRVSITISPARGQVPERSIYELVDRTTRQTTRWSVPGKTISTQELPQGGGCWSSEDARVITSAPSTESLEMTSGATPASVSMPERTSEAGVKVDTVREDLGTQSIQGLKATGTRITTTTPADYAGNDAPLISTEERWISKDYGLTVRDYRDDPQTGKTTVELTEFTVGEPDASLFLPPSGYQVQEVHLHKVPCERR